MNAHDVPQIQGMYNGDAARKKTLIEFGFRLPSAADNRPLRFPEFEKRIGQLSIRPRRQAPMKPNEATFEKLRAGPDRRADHPSDGARGPKDHDPPARGQVDDLIPRIEERVKARARACDDAYEANGRGSLCVS